MDKLLTSRKLKRAVLSELLQGKAKIGIVGADPMSYKYALELAQEFSVVLFDSNPETINLIRRQVYSFDQDALSLHRNIEYTNDYLVLKTAKLFIVGSRFSDLNPSKLEVQDLVKLTYQVGKVLKNKDIIVFESSAYPGFIDEVCIPLLVEVSGSKLNSKFKVGFVPQNDRNAIGHLYSRNLNRWVSGSDNSAINQLSGLYAHLLKAPIEKAPTIRFAEILDSINKSQIGLTQSDLNTA